MTTYSISLKALNYCFLDDFSKGISKIEYDVLDNLSSITFNNGFKTKYVYDADAASADLILVMESQHQYALRGIVPQEQWDKIQLFMMYCFGSRSVLTDPSGFFSDDLYRDTRDTLERGCDVIVEKIQKPLI